MDRVHELLGDRKPCVELGVGLCPNVDQDRSIREVDHIELRRQACRDEF